MFENAIVLTGGIATGKSTVSNFLKMYGYSIIDADKIAHRLLDKNSDKIATTFGREFIKEGRVDRKELGKLIFSDKEARKKLEELLHPLIKEAIEAEATKLEKHNIKYFVDIPLFFETKNYDIKTSLVIYTPKELQLIRVIKRDKLSNREAIDRINSQMDIEEKKKLATYVIDNSSDLKHLQREVEKFMKKIKA